MRRVCFSLISLISTLVVSSSALAYYQDKFNPRSSSFDSSYRGYYQGSQNRGGYNRIKTFTNYAAYAHAVRNAMDRSYNFPAMRTPTGNRVFIYDPKQLSWAAYDSNGQLVRTGPGSAGNHYCEDVGHGCRTPVGTFKVQSKKGANHKSNLFPIGRGGAPMPYAIFFNGSNAIHGSLAVMEHNASHGCIRTLIEDAQWLNNSFLTYGSTVIIRPYN